MIFVNIGQRILCRRQGAQDIPSGEADAGALAVARRAEPKACSGGGQPGQGDEVHLFLLVAVNPEEVDVAPVIPGRTSADAMRAKTHRAFAYRTCFALNFYEPPALLVGEVVTARAEGEEDPLSSRDERRHDSGFGTFADL
ncbi:MAG: hypothetical protein M3N53_08260 [Actinomycetota bacterium]|nr:hypothetical protein [Actinomycetota bacterium]